MSTRIFIGQGNKELFEKLGRSDLCPCGPGRSFSELLLLHRLVPEAAWGEYPIETVQRPVILEREIYFSLIWISRRNR